VASRTGMHALRSTAQHSRPFAAIVHALSFVGWKGVRLCQICETEGKNKDARQEKKS